MKKSILVVLMLVACNSYAATATGKVQYLSPKQKQDVYCAGYTQGVLEDQTPGTGSEQEAGAAVAFFYQELADQGLDDSEEGSGGAATPELDKYWKQGYDEYQRTTNVDMPKKCFDEYSRAVQEMSNSELSEPYKK